MLRQLNYFSCSYTYAYENVFYKLLMLSQLCGLLLTCVEKCATRNSCWECNKMMELSGKESPSLSGPAGYFWRKSIFRLCLFLDIWIMSIYILYWLITCNITKYNAYHKQSNTSSTCYTQYSSDLISKSIPLLARLHSSIPAREWMRMVYQTHI